MLPKTTSAFFFLLVIFLFCGATEPAKTDYVQLSQDFLRAAKTGGKTADFISQLKTANQTQLLAQLNTDPKRLAFWLNLYNGFTQVILKKNPEQYKSRNSFFSSEQIVVAGEKLSLDEIEHGILRRSKTKWSGGYVGKISVSNFEQKFRVDKLDYRIHFALNCGAKSCPPIAFYEPAKINQQLEMATKTYLKSESVFNQLANKVEVPATMGWFRADFGGKKGILDLLKKNNIVPQQSNPDIAFKEYDWTLFLNNYKS